MACAERIKITIEIDNLTEPQALAIEDLMAMWQHLGGVGGSRWTAFYADGDGNFRPKITVDGRRPVTCELTDSKKRWKSLWEEDQYGQHPQDIYMLDFDSIAWAMHKEPPAKRPEKTDA